MAPPFPKSEFDARVAKVRQAMASKGLDAMVVGDPSNINWLTGFDAWSFYTPQVMVVAHDREPLWIGRLMDAKSAFLTTHLKPESVLAWPEHLVHRTDIHPMDWAADNLRKDFDGKRIGYESDGYYFSPRSLDCLRNGLANARFIDADLLVNWQRAVKSEAEIAVMRQAGRLAELAHATARKTAKVGVRQCDLMAEIIRAGVAGTPQFGGDLAAIYPLILAGEAAAAAHPMWTDEPLANNQTISLELGGCRKRYNVGLARTLHFGKPPQQLLDTSKAVGEGLDAVLDVLKAGVTAGACHAAWQNVLNRYGLEKKSRIGYSIGVAYGPDWGEHTISLRPNEPTIIEANSVIHVMLGMWFDDWGMELSETVLVKPTGNECLTNVSRGVYIVD